MKNKRLMSEGIIPESVGPKSIREASFRKRTPMAATAFTAP